MQHVMLVSKFPNNVDNCSWKSEQNATVWAACDQLSGWSTEVSDGRSRSSSSEHVLMQDCWLRMEDWSICHSLTSPDHPPPTHFFLFWRRNHGILHHCTPHHQDDHWETCSSNWECCGISEQWNYHLSQPFSSQHHAPHSSHSCDQLMTVVTNYNSNEVKY